MHNIKALSLSVSLYLSLLSLPISLPISFPSSPPFPLHNPINKLYIPQRTQYYEKSHVITQKEHFFYSIWKEQFHVTYRKIEIIALLENFIERIQT